MAHKKSKPKPEINEKKLLARMSAVKGIARRNGYERHKADEIAQQVAIAALEGRNVEAQSNGQTYVDCLREGSERAYTRAGKTLVPLFESQFPDYPNLVAGIGEDFNPGSLAQNRGDVFDVVAALTSLPANRLRAVILYFYEGWTLDEISKPEGVSESRISQLVADAVERTKAKVIQSRLSQEKQGERKQEEFRELLQKETRPWLDREEKGEMARVFEIKGFGVDSFALEEIPEELCSSF